MNVVDSSAWLEYLTGSEWAERFAEPIEKTASLIVPVIVIYELFKKVYRERGEDAALEVYGLLAQGTVVDIEPPLALAAARIPLPLADSLIYATAQLHRATLWTQDEHFQGMAGVRYFPKGKEEK
ncbi:MAG: type II toxin-antitoxin system VapC family toxin [Verrucomicrobia bacterium]|nr:type II toxin-antitoxin system VapC family toxin [Verrucomicrobiota bacterium]